MHITVTSVPVPDQDKALVFYTRVLGFRLKHDLDLGGGQRWLTLVSAAAPEGVELLLEPLGFPPAAAYQRALYEAGIPWTQFGSSDLLAEYDRLAALGVAFRGPPQTLGPVRIATFDDTCGNLIRLAQVI